MTAACRMLEPTGDVRGDVALLAGALSPLLDAFWNDRGRAWYGAAEWRVQAVPLTQLWMDRTLTFVTAEEDGRPVGFLTAIHVTPIFTDSPTFHVEAYYGETPEAERALLEFVRQAFGFFQDRQLVVPRYGDAVPMPDAPWRRTARRLDVMSR